MNWLDRAILFMAPRWGQSRARARLMARHFESASSGRRTENWSRRGTDANAAAGGNTLAFLRAQARDLVRNNPWARRGLRRICSDAVGWGIRPKINGRSAEQLLAIWKQWAETTQCDSAGRLNFYGLQRLAMRTIAESGEVLVRRRMRLPVDGLAVPMQLQILEPDFLDHTKDGMMGAANGPIIQGVEFDAIGRRVAYWLFDQHPGGLVALQGANSRRIPSDGILHVYDQERAGQVRGPSWFASVDVRLHDFAEFEDATLVKQKIAACMAAFVTDLDGTGVALAQGGTDSASGQLTDTFEPGTIVSLPVGKQVTIANPPTATDHTSYSQTALRGIAAGLGTTYADLTGDYSQANYSSERASRIAHQGDVEAWQWHMLIPQLCQPAWKWMTDALALSGLELDATPADWSPPPMPILDPQKTADAYRTLIRCGLMTLGQAIRELGYDPSDQLAEIDEMNQQIDKLEIALDCDPRKMTAAGGTQQVWLSGSIAAWPPKEADELIAATAAAKQGAKQLNGTPPGSGDSADSDSTASAADDALAT